MTTNRAVEHLRALKAGKRFERIEEALEVLATLEDHYLDLARRHEELFMRAPAAILTVDGVGRITAHNDHAAETMLGPKAPALTYIGPLIDPADRPAFMDLLTMTRQDGSTRQRDLRIVYADGRSVFSRVAARPLPDKESVCVTITDIDDLKTTEQRLDADARRNKALLRETNHRTKNLLQIIRSSLEIKTRSAKSAEGRHIAQGVRSQVMSLQGAVNALTGGGDVSRIDARALIGELLRHLAAGVREGIAIRFDSEGDGLTMPAEDATSLSLAISELCFNAVEHAFPDQRSSGRIAVFMRRAQGEAQVTVTDDGVGFDGTAASSGHLGLVIVRDLIEGHLDGTIEWIPQSPGTEVRIRIPIPTGREDEP